MTAIKQVAVTSASHFKNLTRYLNDDRALMRNSQNLADSTNWAKEMERTREAYGHNKASRAGAANTVMYHQIIAFNPDECSVNGGTITPERAMQFAHEWILRRYPDQEVIWVLHRERCAADRTERYAVHIGINRTNLVTGLRLNEGRSKNAKVERANAIRDMDREWGLRQLEAGRRNSMVHTRQPSRAEKEMEQRGVRSDKLYIREAVSASVREVQKSTEKDRSKAFANALDRKGVDIGLSKAGDDFTFTRRKTGLKVNGVKLGRGYSRRAIARAIGKKAAYSLENVFEQSMDSM